jgi:putative flippase GtrA
MTGDAPAVRVNKAIEVMRFIKGQLSSSTATAVDWVGFAILNAIGVDYRLAKVLSAVFGGITDFSIKRYWVFKSAQQRAHAEAFRYFLVSGTSALMNGGAIYLFVGVLHLGKSISVALTSLAVALIWNYPMHRLFVFSPAPVTPPTEQP